ncbi:MAG: S8 family peptidase [Steroidobacteraceae bacterium]
MSAEPSLPYRTIRPPRIARIARLALTSLLALLASACAIVPTSSHVAPLPVSARVQSSRYVVVTVRNMPQLRAERAGSTPRGYDTVGLYGVTAAAKGTVRALEHTYGLHEVSAWPIATLHVHCIVFRLPEAAARTALIAQLARDPRVESAQPLNEFSTQADVRRPAWMPYNDPYAPLQRALRELDVVGAQRVSRGAGVRIAIIDTGVDLRHPDLRDRIVAHRNFVDRDAERFSRDRHGTEVAGVMAAVADNGIGIVGVAPDAQLLALKSCWQRAADAAQAVCDSFTLAQGLEAALLAHADVVNLSLAGPPDPLLARLVRAGEHRGMLFVGAVAPSATAGFPTDIPGVLAVESAEDGPRRAGDLFAPGRDILTLVPGGHYDFASGSSLAAAEVSGILALMISRHGHLTPAEAERILAGSAQSSEATRRELSTQPHAVINACRALAAVVGRLTCGPGTTSLVETKNRSAAAP